MKKIKLIIIFIVILFILLAIFILNKVNILDVFKLSKIQMNNEDFSFVVYDNQDEEKIGTLVTITSDNGIEYIENRDGNKIAGYGKKQIAMDCIIKKGEEQVIKIKEIGEEIIEKRFQITDETIKQTTVKIDKIYEIDGFKTINIEKVSMLDNFKIYYQIGEGQEWQEGNATISILDYDVTQNGLINDDNTITITAKLENKEKNNVVMLSDKYIINPNSTLNSFPANSIIEGIQEYANSTGLYRISVNGIQYNLDVHCQNTDMIVDGEVTIGSSQDVATSTENAKNMVVLKVNGNLTINPEAKLTAVKSDSGYGGPKGMLIYCTGTLTNNGTITMTERGAKADGEDVYIWKNSDNSYECVPALGALGGAASGGRGNIGKSGKDRQTGGGSSGAGSYATSGAGGRGTSYSGGTGGGSALENGPAGGGTNNGGKGGNATTGGSNESMLAGGGAGNPGGNSAYRYNVSAAARLSGNGKNGTGGLLIIYANIVNNNSGSITSNGSSGGTGWTGGGSSGGGSINIFYNERIEIGTLNANGGATAWGSRDGGNLGGTGSISVGQIVNGSYVSTFKNYE